jgi:hypothetical protein
MFSVGSTISKRSAQKRYREDEEGVLRFETSEFQEECLEKKCTSRLKQHSYLIISKFEIISMILFRIIRNKK